MSGAGKSLLVQSDFAINETRTPLDIHIGLAPGQDEYGINHICVFLSAPSFVAGLEMDA